MNRTNAATRRGTKHLRAECYTSDGKLIWHMVRHSRDRRYKCLPTLCGRYLHRSGSLSTAEATAETIQDRVLCPMYLYELENGEN